MRLGEHDMNMKRAETLAQVLDTPLALAGLFGVGGGTEQKGTAFPERATRISQGDSHQAWTSARLGSQPNFLDTKLEGSHLKRGQSFGIDGFRQME